MIPVSIIAFKSKAITKRQSSTARSIPFFPFPPTGKRHRSRWAAHESPHNGLARPHLYTCKLNRSGAGYLLFSVADFSVVVELPESGALLSVFVVVVVSEDFSDTAGLAATPGAPCSPCAPAGPGLSLHPTLQAPTRSAITPMAVYLAVVFITVLYH